MNLVIVHGALGCKIDFEQLSRHLEKNGITCHCLELSGHGASPGANKFDIAQFTSELTAFVESINDEQLALFGYSMGGYIVLNYLANFASKNIPFATLATKWLWSPEIAAREQNLCSINFLSEKAPTFLNHLKTKHLSLEPLLLNTSRLIGDLGNQLPLSLKTISSPGLILTGDGDKLVPAEEGKLMAAEMLHAKHLLLPDTKHAFDQVDTRLLTDTLVDFFNTVR